MKSHTTRLAVLVFCVVLLGVSVVTAQNPRAGGVAAPELLIPIGARDMALSGSSIATSNGVESIHWNPAGLGKMPGSAQAMVSSMSYIADISVLYGAVAGKFGDFGSLGVSMKSLSFGNISLTSEEDPEGKTGRFYTPTYVTIGFTYARSLTDAVTVGVTGKIISETIDQVSSSGFGFDFGIQYRGLLAVQGLTVGIAIKNIGPSMQFNGPGLYRSALISDGLRPVQKYQVQAASFELPALVEFGLSYDRSFGDNFFGGVNGTFSNNNLYYDEYRGGLEVGYNLDVVTLVARGGYSTIPSAEENIFGSTFGIGLNYKTGTTGITLDFGYRQVQYFDANQVFSLKVDF